MNSAGSQRREEGAALILTLLVLAILVILVVQFSFSIKVEENVVQNTQDDSALELAARGAIPWLEALLRDDRAAGAPSGPVDTLADVLFDPNSEEQRELEMGDITLRVEAEDLDRRFPLVWLADERKREWGEGVLQRLLEKLEVEGDPEQLAQSISSAVQGLVEDTGGGDGGDGGGLPPPPTGGSGGEDVGSRGLFSISQLISDSGGSSEGSEAPPADGEGGGDVPPEVFYGDPQADPPRPGLAAFVTAWPTGAINLNTAIPEVLEAVFSREQVQPEDQNEEPRELTAEEVQEIVEGIVGRRIDPISGGGGGGGGDDEEGSEESGDQGASRSWPGAAFTELQGLREESIHALLPRIVPEDGSGQGSGPGSGSGGGGAGAGTGSGSGAGFGLMQALDVQSRFYAVRVTASLDGGVQSVFRMVLHRNDQDRLSPLMIELVPE